LTTDTSMIVIEIRSKYCRSNKHQDCDSRWNGFGFEIVCSCECHLSKKGVHDMDEVLRTEANAVFNCESQKGA
jgi:hypothetical protein